MSQRTTTDPCFTTSKKAFAHQLYKVLRKAHYQTAIYFISVLCSPCMKKVQKLKLTSAPANSITKRCLLRLPGRSPFPATVQFTLKGNHLLLLAGRLPPTRPDVSRTSTREGGHRMTMFYRSAHFIPLWRVNREAWARKETEVSVAF